MTTFLRFAITTPRIPVTVDTFETRRPNASPKVTTVLHFATTTPPIPVTVDTFETRRRSGSPTVTTGLRFAKIFGLGRLRTHGGRLRTPADACGRSARISHQLPHPRPPTSKREPFCCAFRKNCTLNASSEP